MNRSAGRDCEQITFNAETAESAEEIPKDFLRVLRVLRSNVVFSHALKPSRYTKMKMALAIRQDAILRWRLPDLANRIRWLVLRLVVGARLELGEQAERDKLDAGKHEQNAKQQQGPIQSSRRIPREWIWIRRL